MLKKQPLCILIAAVFALSLSANAFADDDGNGGENEVSEHGSTHADVEHVTSMVGGATARITTTQDGHYEITLSNGSTIAVRPQGNTRVHRNTKGITTTSVDTDGHLHVQTADGYEMTVDSAAHSEAETHSILAQNGLNSIVTKGGRLTAVRSDGTHVSVEADYQVNRSANDGAIQYHESSTGLDIDFADGTHQHFHGAAADTAQLRASAQSLGYATTFNSDGTVTATNNGAATKVKLSPILNLGLRSQPGLRLENSKVVMQYRDGMEQEIIIVR